MKKNMFDDSSKLLKKEKIEGYIDKFLSDMEIISRIEKNKSTTTKVQEKKVALKVRIGGRSNWRRCKSYYGYRSFNI